MIVVWNIAIDAILLLGQKKDLNEKHLPICSYSEEKSLKVLQIEDKNDMLKFKDY